MSKTSGTNPGTNARFVTPTNAVKPDALARLTALADAATDGTWYVEQVGDYGDKSAVLDIARWRGYTNTVNFGEDFATAEFIAAADPDAVRALVAEVERLREKLKQPCGSCHPCTEWAAETWRQSGGPLPHKHVVDEAFAERDRLRDGFEAGLREAASKWLPFVAGGRCPTCVMGRSRETAGMVCQTCGTDYGQAPDE